MHNEPAIVIIEHFGPDGENKAIGPFQNGEAASNWAFKNLEHGIQWYWMPFESPESVEEFRV